MSDKQRMMMKHLGTVCMMVFWLGFHFSAAQETVNKPAKQLYGYDKDVSSLAVSPNGQYLAGGSWKNKVILWDLDSMTAVWEFQAHKSTVEKIDFGPDSRYFATCSNDAEAFIWDAETQKKSLALAGHRSNVNDVVFNDHYKGNVGRFVATGTKNGVVRIFDRERDGKILRKIKLKNTSARALAFGPNGRKISVACGDHVVRIFDFLKDNMVKKFKAHNDKINALKASPDGTRLLTASDDKTAKIWSYAKGRMLQKLKGHTWRVLSANFSADGNYVATGSNDGTARLWKAGSGKQRKVFKPSSRDYMRAVAITPDNQYLISASLVRKGKDAGILFWESALSASEK